jgi:hypothetical protein
MVISGNYSKPLMFFQVLTMALLVLSAIISWRAYTKKYVDYEVQHRLTQQTTE